VGLAGKNILITGGTSVLGESLVRQAMLVGARVFFTWRRDKEKADELEKLGARSVQLDLTSSEAIRQTAEKISVATRTLHGLVHNAAMTCDAMVENLTEDDWDQVIDANAKAPFLLTRELMPALEKANPGRVIALTSRAATSGVYGAANYAASKAALEAWVKTLAREADGKVLVNAVNPGFMLSGMTNKVPEKARELQRNLSAIKKYSDPDAVAKAILFLLSDENTQITGQVLNLESRMSWSVGSVPGAKGDGD